MILFLKCIGILIALCASVLAGPVIIENAHSRDIVYLYNNTVSFANQDSLSQNTTILPGKHLSIDARDGTIFYAWVRSKPYQILVTGEQGEKYTFGPQQLVTTVKRDYHLESLYTYNKYIRVKVRSLAPAIDIYAEDTLGASVLIVADLKLNKEEFIISEEGIQLVFTRAGEKNYVLSRSTLQKEHALYTIIDKDSPPPFDLIQQSQKEQRFQQEYRNRTGRAWVHHYDRARDSPRGAPGGYMWPAGYIGKVTAVNVSENHWHKEGRHWKQAGGGNVDLELKLETISVTPRMFVVKDFLSSSEADALIADALPGLEQSAVGAAKGSTSRVSKLRTSSNAWLRLGSGTKVKKRNYLVDALCKRAMQMLKLDERQCSPAKAMSADPSFEPRLENMQVVHYKVGEQYGFHYDWAPPVVQGDKGRGGESRFITLLLYLTDMASPTAGGETAFPKAKFHSNLTSMIYDDNGEDDVISQHGTTDIKVGIGGSVIGYDDDDDGDDDDESTVPPNGLKVHPGKGGAVLFYNLLEDGNGDALALHSSLPVLEGEKWLANFWVWDPKL